MAGRSAPDLVITDYKMPGMDGADFIRAFRLLPGARRRAGGGGHGL